MMNKKEIQIPIAIQVISWFLIISMLLGILFLGDRTPGGYLLNGLIVVVTGIFILVQPKTPKHLITLLIIGALGLTSLCILIVNDLSRPTDYIGVVLKSFLLGLYIYLIISVLLKIKAKNK